MINSEENRAVLESYAEEYGIHLTTEQSFALLKHLDLVVDKNKVVNLTRIIDDNDAIIRHVVDSLLFVPSIDALKLPAQASFVDIGTGAGFPGVPIALTTGHQGLLIDSVGKKVKAVQEFIDALNITGTEAASVRAEDLARERYQAFDLTVARAVADLGVLIEYAAPLLKSKGSLVVSKGRITDDEISRGDRTAKIVGLKRVSRETYELPLDMGHREVFTYRKIGKSQVKLPRQTGMAKHKPLVD